MLLRPHHSTTMAILEPIKIYTAGVFIDLKKAFDTVNHEIDKLNFYGICDILLAWLTSHWYTSSHGHVYVVCRFFQHSVLGPLHFLIYQRSFSSFELLINNFNSLCWRYQHLSMSWPLEKTFLMLNFHLSSWFNAKKLTVHPAKSKFIIFIHDINRLIISSNVNIFINNAPITHEQGDQFHGIIIHKSLAWKPHNCHLW